MAPVRMTVVGFSFALGLFAIRPARAQEDPRPQQARAACTSGDVDKGVALLAELHRATDDPIWIFNQGRCYQDNGRSQQALEKFREYQSRAPSGPADVLERARKLIAELEAKLPPAPAATAPSPVAPTRTAVVTPPAPSPTDSPPPPVTNPAVTVADAAPAPSDTGLSRKLRIGAIALAGTGVVALGTGIFSGAKVQSLDREAQRKLEEPGLVPAKDFRSLEDRAGRYEVLQWVGYGTAALTFAGAGVCWYLAETRGEAPRSGTAGPGLALTPAISPVFAGGALTGTF